MRSSPVIAPPSLVATIFCLTLSSFSTSWRRPFATGSAADDVCARAEALARASSIRSTRALMSSNSPCARMTASNCSVRSAGP